MASLRDRLQATYNYVFDRKRAYQLVFRNPSGRIVLEDLAGFCRADPTKSPPWGTTPEDTARYVGRLEVYHRIVQHLNLSPEELFQLVTENRFPVMRVEADE